MHKLGFDIFRIALVAALGLGLAACPPVTSAANPILPLLHGLPFSSAAGKFAL